MLNPNRKKRWWEDKIGDFEKVEGGYMRYGTFFTEEEKYIFDFYNEVQHQAQRGRFRGTTIPNHPATLLYHEFLDIYENSTTEEMIKLIRSYKMNKFIPRKRR